MIAAQDDHVGVVIGKLHHAVEDAGRVRAAINQVAEKNDFVVANVPGHIVDELIQ